MVIRGYLRTVITGVTAALGLLPSFVEPKGGAASIKGVKPLWPIRLLGCALVAIAAVPPVSAQADRPAQLKVIEVKQPDGQILSYRHLAGSSSVRMRGTQLAPEARIDLKIGSRPGFVEIDINRGAITGLKPAPHFGKDFLTYVLWAVSVDGRASNLGEITFEDDKPLSINVTTPYQTFWLMVTAEPNYAVVDPSPRVVLYSVKGDASESRAMNVRGETFFFTHYTAYDTGTMTAKESAPNQLLQARKAVELASKSGVLGAPRSGGPRMREEEYTREALHQAKAFLRRAEEAYTKNPKSNEVVQFARTAAQSAENARALAMGAVGGMLMRQLEEEVASLREQLAKRDEQPVKAAPAPQPPPPQPQPEQASFIAKPSLWFALIGWLAAGILLFRRRAV